MTLIFLRISCLFKSPKASREGSVSHAYAERDKGRFHLYKMNDDTPYKTTTNCLSLTYNSWLRGDSQASALFSVQEYLASIAYLDTSKLEQTCAIAQNCQDLRLPSTSSVVSMLWP